MGLEGAEQVFPFILVGRCYQGCGTVKSSVLPSYCEQRGSWFCSILQGLSGQLKNSGLLRRRLSNIPSKLVPLVSCGSGTCRNPRQDPCLPTGVCGHFRGQHHLETMPEPTRGEYPNCQHLYSPDSKQIFLGFDQIFLPQTDSKTLSAHKTKAVYITNAAIVSELSSLCGIRLKQGKISSEMDPAQPGTIIKIEIYLNIVFIGTVNYTTVHEDIS